MNSSVSRGMLLSLAMLLTVVLGGCDMWNGGSVDTPPFTVDRILRSRGQVDVKFNALVDNTTVNDNTFFLTTPDNGALLTGLVYTDNVLTGDRAGTATFLPDTLFIQGVTYQITLTSGIRDTNGVALVPFTTTFAF
jgi:hypothetical protein